jgi:hypothetical protein
LKAGLAAMGEAMALTTAILRSSMTPGRAIS